MPVKTHPSMVLNLRFVKRFWVAASRNASMSMEIIITPVPIQLKLTSPQAETKVPIVITSRASESFLVTLSMPAPIRTSIVTAGEKALSICVRTSGGQALGGHEMP
eukprot:scaffold1007_cov364-Prasinococcus_capsulatus_cf.AAC.16